MATLLIAVLLLGAQPAAPVHLRVLMPQADAGLSVDGAATKQNGIERHFTSPPLEPGWTYRYTLKAVWEPNNYTKVTRTRRITVKPGDDVVIDLRRDDPANPDHFHIGFYTTPEDVVEAMLKLAKVGKDDVVYDLGCGDGRIVISAVKDFKAKRGVGIDIDAKLVRLAKEEAKKSKVEDRVQFRQQDVLELKDLADASVVMMYMGDDVNSRLRPILRKSLKAGARIVSHDFKMGDWEPDRVVRFTSDEDFEEHVLYLWTIK